MTFFACRGILNFISIASGGRQRGDSENARHIRKPAGSAPVLAAGAELHLRPQ